MPLSSLSVIIATCGRPERLAVALARVIHAAGRVSFPVELVVCDNHPAGSAATVLPATVPPALSVRYLRSEPYNKSAALNAGIRAACSAWMAFTDDDTLPDADWLARGSEFAVAAGFDLFGGRIVLGDVPAHLPRTLAPPPESGPAPAGGVYVRYDPCRQSGALPLEAPAPFGANIFVHRSVFERRGGYDEALWRACGRAALGVDDGEFGVRLKRAREPIGYCREAVVVHPVHIEKFTMRSRMRHTFRFGWREPVVFPDQWDARMLRYQLACVLRASVRAATGFLAGDPARGVEGVLAVSRTVGALTGRFSKAYRERRTRVDAASRAGVS